MPTTLDGLVVTSGIVMDDLAAGNHLEHLCMVSSAPAGHHMGLVVGYNITGDVCTADVAGRTVCIYAGQKETGKRLLAALIAVTMSGLLKDARYPLMQDFNLMSADKLGIGEVGFGALGKRVS